MKLFRKKGFTLIEVLLALSIFAVVSTGLYFAFRNGVLVFKKSEQGLDKQQEIRFFVATLEKQLRNSLVYEPVGFHGKTDEIIFPSIVKFFDRTHTVEQVVQVRYYYKENHLYRDTEPIRKDQNRFKKHEEILGPLQDFSFHFAFWDSDTKELTWKDEWSWDDLKVTPRAIKVEGRFQVPGEDSFKVRSKPFDFSIPVVIFQGQWGSEKKEETQNQNENPPFFQ